VLVCTRNRKENVVPTIRSILSSSYRNLEIVLLDQSDRPVTREALAPLIDADPRLVYLHLAIPGKPRALNQGLSVSRGEFVLLTDDDCEVAPDWIGCVLSEFEEHPDVACIFGRVSAQDFDASQGYVPICPIEKPLTLRALEQLLLMPGWKNFGMGANMALRRDVLQRIHGWDECIGPGAKFGSGDDHDLSVRLLRSGYPIRFAPSPHVVHYGFRSWGNAGKDYRRIWFGVGGVFAKHLRCGTFYPGGLRVPKDQLERCAAALLRGMKPQGISYIASWLRGFRSGLSHPLNREASMFVPVHADTGRYSDRVADIVLRSFSETGDVTVRQGGLG
jgi:GT2 family glycosyltransferase